MPEGEWCMMQTNRDERACELARWIVENNATVRAAAKRFGISKSTVHKDLSERLRQIDRLLYEKVRLVLDQNIAHEPARRRRHPKKIPARRDARPRREKNTRLKSIQSGRAAGTPAARKSFFSTQNEHHAHRNIQHQRGHRNDNTHFSFLLVKFTSSLWDKHTALCDP